ncbi:MAG: chemotaxis protein CheW [Ignavibacteriaceae bacterium]|nr:chemotaxis protein CheW [Ignavibacteriaceae bacterium]
MAALQKKKTFSGLFIFKIQGQEFCLNLKEIINVLNVPECEIQYKETNTGLEYAGSKYTIISFDKVYKLNYKQSPTARIILTNIKRKPVGFFVDEIIEFMAIDENSTKISRLNSDDNPYVKLIIKIGNREMIMPDFEQIFIALNHY